MARILAIVHICQLIVIGGACASTAPRIPEYLNITVVGEKEKDYRVSDIAIDSINSDTLRVFCRIQTTGKTIRGHLDLAVEQDGKVVYQCGVRPKMRSRIGGYTISAIGFPFEFELPSALLRNNSLRLSYHKDSAKRSSLFDCRSNR